MKIVRISLGFLTLLQAVSAHATTILPPAHITSLGGGWVQASVAPQLDIAAQNPDNCASNAQYITDPGDSGSVLFNSMLLTAFSSGRRVQLTINGCSGNFPHIIGVLILSQ